MPITMLKMIDKNESNRVDKGLLFDLPMRILIVGKSQLSGKTNLIGNLLLRDPLYRKHFEGDNIFIVSPTSSIDHKMKTIISQLDVPTANVFRTYNEGRLDTLYQAIETEYLQRKEDGEKPKRYLFILDDISYNGDLKSHTHGFVAKLACNGRHLNISTIVTAQKYSDILTTFRENCTGAILFSCSNKQLDLIAEDHNFLTSKKDFYKMFRHYTSEPHSFLVVNYSNPYESRYLDKQFRPVKAVRKSTEPELYDKYIRPTKVDEMKHPVIAPNQTTIDHKMGLTNE